MDESYGKCRTCRLCRHAGDTWACIPESRSVGPDQGCPRYRPGCCGSCSSWSSGICSPKGEKRDSLDVCSDYDPSGSFRRPVPPVGQDVLDARLGLRIAEDDPLRRFRDPVVHDVVAQGHVALHVRPHPGVGSLEGANGVAHQRRDPVDVGIDQPPGVHVSRLRQQRIVRAVHEIPIEIVDRIHEVDASGQLDEHVVQVVRMRIAGDVPQRTRQPPAEGPPHEQCVFTSIGLQIPQGREPLADRPVVLRIRIRRPIDRPPQREGYHLRLRGGEVGLVVVQLPFRQDQGVRGHPPHQLGVRLRGVEDADPLLRSFEMQAVADQPLEEDGVERHVVVHGQRPCEAEAVPQLVAPLAVVPAVERAVRRGQPAVGRDRVAEHRPAIGHARLKDCRDGLQNEEYRVILAKTLRF